jgi:hypothetical protein
VRKNRELVAQHSIILKIIISRSSKRHAACERNQQILIEGDNFLCASFSFSLLSKTRASSSFLFRFGILFSTLVADIYA